jgi:hypothetical protein
MAEPGDDRPEEARDPRRAAGNGQGIDDQAKTDFVDSIADIVDDVHASI